MQIGSIEQIQSRKMQNNLIASSLLHKKEKVSSFISIVIHLVLICQVIMRHKSDLINELFEKQLNPISILKLKKKITSELRTLFVEKIDRV